MRPPDRLSHTLRSARIGVWEVEIQTLNVVLDEIAEALFGFAPGTFPGPQKAATDRIHPDDVGHLLRERDRALETKTDLHLEYRILLPDGRVRWVSGTGQGQYDDAGRPVRISGILIDITARKEAEAERERAERLAQAQREELARQGELLRIIADTVPAALIYVDAEERFRFANRFYREHYGRLRDVGIGAHAREVLGEAGYERLLPYYRRAMQGEVATYEGQGGADGHWISATFVPHLGEDGRVLGLSVLSEDLTERRQHERRLHESERQLRLMADTIPQIVWVTSPSGEVEYLNERWYEFTGLPRGATCAERWLSAIHPDDAAGVLARHRSALQDHEPLQLEFRLRRADGAYRWHLARSVFVRDEGGSVVKRYGTATDIHRQKTLETQQRLLTDTFAELIATNDLARRLERSAELAQRLFGGAVTLHLRSGDRLTLAALVDPDPLREAQLRQLEARFPPLAQDRTGPGAVLRSGVAVLSGPLTPDARRALTGPEHDELERRLGFRSTLALPLQGTAGILGVLSLLSPEEVLDRAELSRAEELARYISWAVENAQLFAVQQTALAQVSTVLRAAPVGISFYDRSLRFAQLNQAAAEMIGVESSEAAIGKTQSEVMPAWAPTFTPLLEHVLETGEAVLDRELQVEVNGETRSRLVSYFPVRARESGDGPILGVGATVMDVTEARATRSRLEEAIRTRDEFLATLSHELRTPLTAILGYANMLRTGILPKEKVGHAVEVIERNARAQARLVEDLLDASRLVTGRMRLDLRPTALEPLIANVVDSLRPAAAAKEIELEVRCERVGPMLADPDRLQQVVWNLLSNSIKFTSERGRVTLALSSQRGQVRLSVKDTGIGIPRSFLPHLFERFRQADASSTRAHGGLGLGLAIVKNLVELHGGAVEARSQGKNLGTEIVVTLPFLTPAAEVHGEEPPSGAARGARDVGGKSPRPDLGGATVLVVDDEAETREQLASLIRGHNAQVRAAASAEEALQQLARAPVDVLLSDLAMSPVDGYTLVRRLRRLPVHQGGTLPAIALSALGRTEEKREALAAGFDVHLRKPVEPSELLETLSAALSRRSRT